ncbi:MAG TPA: peptidylprolyl isomerase [Rhodopila sp.]|nr:peptidylprolyl isomerase [Rhodopila sp.]
MNRRLLTGLAAVLLLGAAGDPPAADVVAQRGDVRVTASEVRGMLAELDPATRARVESSSSTLASFVRQQLLNRAILAEARSKGWDQKPDITRRANEARDAVIMNTYLVSLVPPAPGFPDDATVAAAYEANKARFMVPRQFHLAQIVIDVPANASKDAEDEARRKALQLRAKALKPRTDFAELAKQQSQDKTTAPKGGDLGWVREDQLIPAVRDAVIPLAQDGVTEPVRGADGWHVLRLLATKPAAPAPLADVRPQLVQALQQQRAQQALNARLQNMLQTQPIQLNEIELMHQVAGKS